LKNSKIKNSPPAFILGLGLNVSHPPFWGNESRGDYPSPIMKKYSYKLKFQKTVQAGTLFAEGMKEALHRASRFAEAHDQRCLGVYVERIK
jgi:predicted amidophosphoribosyltransferase